ncbi:nicotinate-nucleotide pyrophosphorylase [carboxylating] [Hathewaya proteolytica DSM 3090]|uniref:Probable nicotinate-nucleotide pyrophosphorylase [carboxylating] n=1 Tax=Hathewaya proteolytica DSM 3090 TaxID=1121331 RepID=A0A1M6SHA6_9CLOT|nr:carboxylating nicotinate-nucleotide diphosphorylase [Hathewaya proteolytica]SHK44143.1 nicotinate-nucleotide pyrophosphorylase [carboxylating] [Hathewaya proteolytica DSM 3090]
MNWLVIDKIIKEALVEDNAFGDCTTDAIVSVESRCTVDLISKEKGIIAGLPIFKRVFDILGDVHVTFLVKEGSHVKPMDNVAIIEGNTRNVLTGERVALNLLQRISGIATLTSKFVEKIKGSNAKLLDTRKTTPNLRILEKYAVTMGGGHNHRFNLSDGILIKDNHIDAAGGIKNAIKRVRNNSSFVRKIEVETESLEEVMEALEAGADIIMLDNMSTEMMKEAVKLIDHKAMVEASGNVNLDSIKEIADTGVDYISCGYITHSYSSFDLSMKNLTLK